MNITEGYDLESIQHFQLKYGCYIKVLNFSAISLKPLMQKDNFRMMLAIGCIIFGVINITANLLLLIGLIKTTKRQNFVHKLFIYLTCTDLIAGLILMPTLAYYQLVGLTCPYMIVMMSLLVYVVASDASIVLLISAMRLRTIRNPFARKTDFKTKVALISIQNWPPLFLAIAFVTIYVRGTIIDFQLAGYTSNGLITSLSLAVLLCVFLTFLQLKKHTRRNTKKLNSSVLDHHKKSTGSLLIIGSMMIFFIVIQSPIFYYLHVLLSNASLLSGETFRLTKKMADITCFVNLMNTTVNSIVIVTRSKKIKRYYRRKFGCSSTADRVSVRSVSSTTENI